MLLGLPINGKAVNGLTNPSGSVIEELLGVEPIPRNLRGQKILLSWLKRIFGEMSLTQDSPEILKIRKTRIYIMLLLGLFLFPDTSGNTVHSMYLVLLDDIDQIRTYSWGSATLAHLYRSLCNNAIANSGNWTGCGVLLQAWGWSRMTNLAPIQQNNFEFPYATRWSSLGMNYDNYPHFSITQYRNLIDHLGQDDFIWQPYLGLEAIHEVNQHDSAVWSAKVPIINFTTVEMHNSDRVKLQFRMLQDIPCPPKCIPDKYHTSKVSDQWEYSPWTKYAKHECREWKHRRHFILSDTVFPHERK
ncbi:unnamed protein product [Lathyrus sativus]|nr:unnamed protein product [Lathyrus sativus]